MNKLKVSALTIGLILAFISGWLLLKIIKVALLAVLIALAVLVVSAGVVYLIGRQILGPGRSGPAS
jgi:uncharacterized membrane protein (Fun14 family)